VHPQVRRLPDLRRRRRLRARLQRRRRHRRPGLRLHGRALRARHPELVIVGTDADTAGGVLNDLAARIRKGANLVAGELITFDDWPHRIVPEQLPNPGGILFAANRFYGRPSWASVPALQLSYDDMGGRFPWEEDYAAPDKQPRPGTWTA
jgi:hypothetical protein